MKKILVVGSLNMDFSIEISKFPRNGETVLGKTMSLIPGGKGANQAYAAAKLGGNVSMIGAVGDDSFGEMLVSNLQLVNVDTSGIACIKGVPTGNAFVMIEPDGNNRIIVIQGANKCIDCTAIDKNIRLIDACDVVIVQLEIPIEVVAYVCKEAKRRNKIVVLDPAPAIKNFPLDIFKYVDVIKPNETELAILTGHETECRDDILAAGKVLIQRGAKVVVATLGGSGAVLIKKDMHQFFPAKKVDAVDTTAAGDCFTAAFALAFNGNNSEYAIKFAGRVSSIVVTRKGAQSSIPSSAELLNWSGF
ncbi:ribokinase [Pectinatus frisingensis]|uniref:ribokinase n=1 Tax=Pectinatus frisingensis TaxID=865 RepID=UPI0018C58FCB|nr:ribokinase [Pectinatus frisingensis]